MVGLLFLAVIALAWRDPVMLRAALLAALAVAAAAVLLLRRHTVRHACDLASLTDAQRRERDSLCRRLDDQRAVIECGRTQSGELEAEIATVRAESRERLVRLREVRGYVERLETRLRESNRYGIQLRTHIAQLMIERAEQSERLARLTAPADVAAAGSGTAGLTEGRETLAIGPGSRPAPVDQQAFEAAFALLERLNGPDADAIPGVPVVSADKPQPRSGAVLPGRPTLPAQPVLPARPALRSVPAEPRIQEAEPTVYVVRSPAPVVAEQVIDLTADDDTQPLDLAEVRRHA